MSLTPSGIAKEATLARRFGTSAVKVYEAEATSQVNIVPTSGMAILLLWVSAQPSPDGPANPLRVYFPTNGADPEIGAYRAYVIGHWQAIPGAVDQPLRYQPTTADPVQLTIHYEEFVP